MAYGALLGKTPSSNASNVTYNNAQTSSIITSNNVQGAIDELFTSVSNGKTVLASAITDKGVSTSASDTFQQMANNVASIPSGSFEQISGNDYFNKVVEEGKRVLAIIKWDAFATWLSLIFSPNGNSKFYIERLGNLELPVTIEITYNIESTISDGETPIINIGSAYENGWEYIENPSLPQPTDILFYVIE